jgi:hypothetical protein
MAVQAATGYPNLQQTAKTGSHTHTCHFTHTTTCKYTVSCTLEMVQPPSTAQNWIDEMCLVCHNLRHESYAS